MSYCFLFFLLTWQQHVSYKITANLNIHEHFLETTEYLTYYNNSPYLLETLYIHLYANAYRDNNTIFAKETKEMGDYRFLRAKKSSRGYIDILDVTSNGDSLKFIINETVMAVLLNSPVKPSDSVTLTIVFFLKIPKIFSRLGYQGNHYEIVQWYPKPCVFDELGWHKDPYHAIGEFYGEFGNFDVTITLPGNYIMAATGERVEAKDIEFMDSLIISNKKIDMGERRTVRFVAENIHDFAWVCNPDFFVSRTNIDNLNIYTFYTKKDAKKWKKAGEYSVDAVKRYNKWCGTYPYKSLSIVDGYFRGGMEYPNLVIIGNDEDFLTRSFEAVIIHEIGHQWFYGILGSNEIDEAWLDEGFTTYTEIRYFEDKYGRENSLFKSLFIPPLTRRYYHRLIYYLTWTNQIEKAILTPSYEFIDAPVSYLNAAYSKPGLILCYLDGLLGREVFDRILKEYFGRYQFQHPKTDDFINVCEEISGKYLKPFFDNLLKTTGYSDWRIKGCERNIVQLENIGNILLPVDVCIETDNGGQVFRVDGKEPLVTFNLPEAKKIKKVIIDPYGYSLEANYWNNYYPRRIDIKPILSWPSFDAYQIFYAPYLWYSSEDGITPGFFIIGGEFVDFDFVRGRHQWLTGYNYGLKSKMHCYNFSYQTPVIFKRGWRTRLNFKGSNANHEDIFCFGYITNFGIPFTPKPHIGIKNMFSYYKLNSYQSVDSIDWSIGRDVVLENFLNFNYLNWRIGLKFSVAHSIVGSDWDYIKINFEIKKKIGILIPINARIFGGRIIGTAPRQDQIFLSGALRINLLADLFFSQKGNFSPQEHIHISGDGNMLGYQTTHIMTNEIYCINLELPARFPIRIFGDFSYYVDAGDWKPAFDIGAKLVLGPLSFNAPIYTKIENPWKIRWSIGL